MIDLTPERLRCNFGSCPAVHELADGRLLIIGSTIGANKEIAALVRAGKIGRHEEAVIIRRELLAEVFSSEPKPAA